MMAKHTQLANALSELKQDYLQSLSKKIELMRDLLQKKKWEDLCEEFHKLKGTGKTYGLPEVSIVCQKMESLTRKEENIDPSIVLKSLQLLHEIQKAYLENRTIDLKQNILAKQILSIGKRT